MSLPQHIAIIMDGNGRWAQTRGYNRFWGHLRGARVAKRVIEHCTKLKIPHLTLYAFSTENWFRPTDEVNFLMNLLKRHLNRELNGLMKNNIRFHCIGDLQRLPPDVRKVVLNTIETTKNNTGLQLSFALSYGGRQEIVDAAKAIALSAQSGRLDPNQLDESLFAQYLESRFLPDPDLIIRTSGEQRLSNFFIWQSAYSELYLTNILWPDFCLSDFDQALQDYTQRKRRFGRVQPEQHPAQP